jgi:hypothetical protein
MDLFTQTKEKLVSLVKVGLNISIIAIVALGWILIKVVQWQLRAHEMSKHMPVYRLFFQPLSLFRWLFPKKWQRFHYDWHLHTNLPGHMTPYQSSGSDIIALVVLFGNDQVCIAGPELFVEVKVNGATRYPKDLRTVKVVRRTEVGRGCNCSWRFMGRMY